MSEKIHEYKGWTITKSSRAGDRGGRVPHYFAERTCDGSKLHPPTLREAKSVIDAKAKPGSEAALEKLQADYKEAQRKVFLAKSIESQARSQLSFATELVEKEEEDLLSVYERMNALRH